MLVVDHALHQLQGFFGLRLCHLLKDRRPLSHGQYELALASVDRNQKQPAPRHRQAERLAARYPDAVFVIFFEVRRYYPCKLLGRVLLVHVLEDNDRWLLYLNGLH